MSQGLNHMSCPLCSFFLHYFTLSLCGVALYLTYGVDRDAAYEAGIESVSKESIQALLNEMLAQNNFIELVMKPAVTAEAE